MTSSLLFFSGFAALIYQVLWMRDLAVLFGSSAEAAAVALAVFFAGVAAGAALFARAAHIVERPLYVYGLLEIGIAASALSFVLMRDVYAWVYAPLYDRFSGTGIALLTVKVALAAAALGPPTVLMGATLPAMVQHAGKSAWMYAMNTAGGAAGAFAAGFYLPPVLGFRASYFLAAVVNLAVGAGALVTSRSAASRQAAALPSRKATKRPAKAPAVTTAGGIFAVLAFASGALTIALEVVWLRMFAQVFDNSVYAFSAVVVVALVAFAAASFAVTRVSVANPVPLVLAVAALAVGVQGPLFTTYTNHLSPLSSDDWLSYVSEVFGIAALFVGAGGFTAGLLFPLLLRAVTDPEGARSAGASVGRLLMLNTAGAVAGSLATTFWIFKWLGLWGTCAAISLAYAALAVWTAWRPGAPRRRPTAVVAAAAAIGAVVAAPSLPRVSLDAARGERVLEVEEGSHGTVAVTETPQGRLLRLNNSYSLGGTTDRIERERIQTFLPLLTHPRPGRVFFLGLGTGITAGEALRHPVERVVICELVPEVVRASREYFHSWTRGLAADPRVDIRVEDGRHYLAAADEQFDVVVSDLFVPWHAGAGMLYTREHFENVRMRLRPGGTFAQWLPLYQLSERDFELIARTVLAVFPHVVVWRGDFYANRPLLALVASNEPLHLDREQIITRVRRLAPGTSERAALARVLPFYAGNLGRARSLIGAGALNTDERPLVEYLAPRVQWNTGTDAWFVSTRLVRFLDRLRDATPLDSDPSLAGLMPQDRAYVDAGRFYYRAIVARIRSEDAVAEAELIAALERLPDDVQVSGPFMGLDPLVE